MATIKWAKTATLDLKDIFDYIAKDSAYYAVSFVRIIYKVENQTITILTIFHSARNLTDKNL